MCTSPVCVSDGPFLRFHLSRDWLLTGTLIDDLNSFESFAYILAVVLSWVSWYKTGCQWNWNWWMCIRDNTVIGWCAELGGLMCQLSNLANNSVKVHFHQNWACDTLVTFIFIVNFLVRSPIILLCAVTCIDWLKTVRKVSCTQVAFLLKYCRKCVLFQFSYEHIVNSFTPSFQSRPVQDEPAPSYHIDLSVYVRMQLKLCIRFTTDSSLYLSIFTSDLRSPVIHSWWITFNLLSLPVFLLFLCTTIFIIVKLCAVLIKSENRDGQPVVCLL